ncbi:MAG: phosphate acyltransferase PlsX [Bacteroidetes bacterium]|nr:phosphate acyltransferase PlsX [Bacteroidota bacterium]
MTIAIDMMGGDFAPLEAVKGIAQFLPENENPPHLLCLGDEATLNELFALDGLSNHPFIKILHAPEVIGYNDHPAKALKEKQKSSITIGFQLLAKNEVDAFISAGNTGAMLIGAMLMLKPVEGVLRPTIGTIIPKLDGSTGIMLDAGLNTDCKAEHLNQFAILGSLYAQYMLQIQKPKVALLNVGEEEEKGNLLTKAAYPLLKENNQINFIGNVEGRDLFTGNSEVIVCDGFTGNVVLKMAESFYSIAKERHFEKDEYMSRFQYENYGGIPVLGISKPVIIGHGISNSKAFHNMIGVAQLMVETKLTEKIGEAFK